MTRELKCGDVSKGEGVQDTYETVLEWRGYMWTGSWIVMALGQGRSVGKC